MTAEKIAPARLLVEGVVIVVSILLAFGIDASWQYYQDRDAEVALISSLAREFRLNRDILGATISRVEREGESIQRLVSMSPAEAGSLPADTAWEILEATWIPHSNELVQGAVASAVASGTLALLRQRELREFVAAWPGRVDNIAERAEVMLRQEEIVETEVDRIAGDSFLQLSEPSHRPQLLELVRADGPAMARIERKQFLSGIYAGQMRTLQNRIDSALVLVDGR